MLIDTASGAAEALARTTHSGYRKTSKMLAIFLEDIEDLVRSEDGEKALALASMLPHVAAALESKTLRASCADADAWLERWLLSEATPEQRSARRAVWHAGCTADAPHAEDLGLRHLRLRRHAREAASAWVRHGQFDLVPPRGSDARLALDLVAAAREWYSDYAIDDRNVQANLARLAILR